jgi:CRISPR-associated protein Csx14
VKSLKNAVIAPLGQSPPVITTFIEGIGEKIEDCIILITENKDVRMGYELIRVAMKLRYPSVHMHKVVLPFEDVYTTDDNLKFMAICAKIIKEEREIHKCDKIFLNVAGGRKNMCISLSLLGQIMAVDGVFHIIKKDVDIINVQLEKFRSEIEKIYMAKDDEEKIKIYEQYAEDFDKILFPSPKDYELIRIPTLPYPPDYLGRIISKIFQDIDSLTLEEKKMLERHGILERVGNRFQLTDYGERFLGVFRK